jgi:protein-S-isoprenylcysteine O-methyltransferase Ste14
MSELRTAIFAAWIAFWVYWLVSAAGAKQGSRTVNRFPGLILVVLGVVLLRVFRTNGLAVHSAALAAIGTAVFASGLALAIWARVHLGRNWGMPMTRKDEPELVTSGPYRLIRHPIYSGILLGLLGTSLATNLYWLIAFAAMGAYFIWCARVEEGLMTRAFPDAYPTYRSRTKMLVPFLL